MQKNIQDYQVKRTKSKEVARMDALLKYLFNLEEGLECFELLKTKWLLAPVAPLLADIRYADQREGENKIIRYIENIAYPVLKKEKTND